MAYKRKPDGKKHNKNAVKHGTYRADKHLVHDKRTRIAKMVFHIQQSLTEALGGSDALSPQQKIVVDRASFKTVRCILAEKEMLNGNGVPEALETDYLRWSHSLRDDLRVLGFERRAKEIQSLKEYVTQTYGNEVSQQ